MATKKANIMTNQSRQLLLDIEKMQASEAAGKDLCGSLEYCSFCTNKDTTEFPCAKAYNKLKKAAKTK